MRYIIKNASVLKKLLLLDALLGGVTAMIGFLFFTSLTTLLGLPVRFILAVSAVNALYSLVAFTLTAQPSISISLLRILVTANWVWTFISIVLFFLHYPDAQILGIAFLILQIPVVGALAYLENRQLVKVNVPAS